ncbi:MAG: fumarylacetoacetate hydrolase family protein [Actinomycetia bacterium]|nr:fumarylacetoacetate hydrolase family protein [Actinomycetes bacterium]
MRWGTVEHNGEQSAAIWRAGRVATVRSLNARFGRTDALDLETLIATGAADGLAAWLADRPEAFDAVAVDEQAVRVLAPLRHPERIVGIGLNYRAHAADLSEKVPEEPATFLKPQTAIIGPGDPIRLPRVSERVTAEAEVALVFARTVKNVARDAWRSVIFGVVPVLDMTAEDILRKNPRFLTRVKGYDTFISLGPWIVTLDEIPDLEGVRVQTVVNGEVKAENVVAGMTYDCPRLVEFVTTEATVGATAILSTGTPGAAVIRSGDVAEARIAGIGTLVNPVA